MQNKILCLAVDDEPPALQVIEKYVSAVSMLEMVATCGNAVDALEVLQKQKIDLLFLDIQMPFILGTDFMRTLLSPPKVIFTTAYRKFAIEGFELDAVDYLLKPISFERFLKAVNKIMKLNINANDTINNTINTNKPTENYIYLRADRKNIRINYDEILYIESLKDYIKVCTKDKTIISKQSISTLEETLPPALFLRIHRSYIIGVQHINSYTPEIIQISKYQLPISRSYRHEVEKALAGKS